jgi:ATP-binding cassette subfamily F protein uup
MQIPIFSLRSICLSFGDRKIIEGGDISVRRGDRIGLVGRNGAGKTTLLRLFAGQIESDSGECIRRAGLRIGYLTQDVSWAKKNSIYQFVAEDLKNPTDEYVPSQIASILGSLNLSPDRLMGELSGGEVRRAALGRAILLKPDLLLLDEPTNHLDVGTIEWFEEWLLSFKGAVIIVSHDRALLRRVADRILWLHGGEIKVHDGGFDSFEVWSEKIRASEEEAGRKQSKKLSEEEKWLGRGVTARRKRNQGRLRKLKTLRAERREAKAQEKYGVLGPTVGEQGGGIALEAKNISMQYGGQQLVREFSIRIRRGDRIAITGPNGAGKTTLLRLLIGDLVPQAGAVTLAPKMQPLYFDQHRDALSLQSTLWESLCPEGGDLIKVGGETQHVVGYLRKFLFSESQLREPISSLSGGERSRLLLAKIFAGIGNLFALDEPTNDLDIETLDLLQEVISDYEGTVLFVSHDREFIDRIATGILAVDGTGSVTEYIGGYGDYLRMQPHPKRKIPKKRGAKTKDLTKQRTSLGYKESRELARLPDEIGDLYRRFKELEETLSDPTLYKRDRSMFEKTTNEVGCVEENIRQREARWMDLEEQKEIFQKALKNFS